MFKKLLLILALLFSFSLYAEHHEAEEDSSSDMEITESDDGEETSGDEE